MSAAHTPGPWIEGERNESMIRVWAPESQMNVALVYGAPFDRKSMEANHRLIASAPELLAALREVLPLIDSQGDAWQSDLVRAAIAKATGSAA